MVVAFLYYCPQIFLVSDFRFALLENNKYPNEFTNSST